MTEAEFDKQFAETLNAITVAMAENPEIDPEKFFGMTCILENLRFFSPVLYSALVNPKK